MSVPHDATQPKDAVEPESEEVANNDDDKPDNGDEPNKSVDDLLPKTAAGCLTYPEISSEEAEDLKAKLMPSPDELGQQVTRQDAALSYRFLDPSKETPVYMHLHGSFPSPTAQSQ